MLLGTTHVFHNNCHSLHANCVPGTDASVFIYYCVTVLFLGHVMRHVRDGKVARVQLSRRFPGTPTITLELALACLLLLTSRSRSGVWLLEDKYTESENSFFMPS